MSAICCPPSQFIVCFDSFGQVYRSCHENAVTMDGFSIYKVLIPHENSFSNKEP